MKKQTLESALKRMSLLVLASVLLIAGSIHMTLEFVNLKNFFFKQLETSDRVLVNNIISSLVFEDVKDAETLIVNFTQVSNAENVQVYDSNGRLFYSHGAKEEFSPSDFEKGGEIISDFNKVEIRQIIQHQNYTIGYIKVRHRLDNLHRLLLSQSLIFGMVIVFILILTNLLISRITERLTRPLKNQVKILEQIKEERNFEYRLSSSEVERGISEIALLEQSINSLLIEIQDNYGKLKDEKLVAEKALEIRNQFVNNMSHEIRTPMNVIIGLSELLEDAILSEEQQHYMEIFRNSCESLISLVDVILDLSRIESGEFDIELEFFDVDETLKNITELYKSNAEAKGLYIEYETHCNIDYLIRSDKDRLAQIFMNLVSNAIKFTHVGGVTILIEQMNLDRDRVKLRFTVRDTGIGIGKDDLEKIFEDFYQTDSGLTRKFQGSGLGLSISRKIIHLMGGKIHANSIPGAFTEFILDMSFEYEKNESHLGQSGIQDKQHKRNQLDDSKKKILVVEDNLENVVVLKTYLKKCPYIIEVAENGLKGLEMFKKFKYDLVLMDIQMPVMDGHTSTQKMRDYEAKNNLVPTLIYALTAHTTKSDILKCIESGCDGHIPKPVRKKQIIELLENILNDQKAA
ncbi:MAG: response regulator [Halobacteriovoraceae bacterium]|nr:response regulator [Halobacteriovoraceae bacterium]